MKTNTINIYSAEFVEQEDPKAVFGCMQENGKIIGDIILPIDINWEVDEDAITP